MGIELIFLVVALCSVFVTRGSYKKLFSTGLNHVWTLAVVLAGFLAIEFAPIKSAQYDSLGFVLLLATYVFLFGFCIANTSLKGMWVVVAGLASNALVIGLNRGMPVSTSGGYIAKESIKHQPESPHDLLGFLSDIFPINALSIAVSVGDIVFGAGLLAVFYFASRKDPSDKIEIFESQELAEVAIEADAKDLISMDTVVDTEEAFVEAAQGDDISIFIDLTHQEKSILDNVASIPVADSQLTTEPMVTSSRGPKVRKSDTKRQAKLEKMAQRRTHKKWQKTHGLAALPSKEALGFDEESMEVVDVAQ